jgi:CubicO group peptidase (beta-lactamase class C family)
LPLQFEGFINVDTSSRSRRDATGEAMRNSYDAAIDWVRDRVGTGDLPAAVIGIATADGQQTVESFGFSMGHRVRTTDYFGLYSLSKPLVALATMRVVQAGRLSLQDSLDTALLGTPSTWSDAVRLEHLLSHTSGIEDVALDDPTPIRQSLLAARRLFVAGSMVSYSNLAFEGVAAMVGAATGRTIYEHVSDLNSVAFPNGITFDAAVDAHPVHGAKDFGMDIGVLQGHRHPAAGAYASAPALLDLGVRVLRSIRAESEELLREPAMREMLRPRTLGLPEPVPSFPRKDYGLGWHLRQTSPGLADTNVFGHAGLSGTQWWIYPERGITLVLLTNLIDAENAGVAFDDLNDALTTGLDQPGLDGAQSASDQSPLLGSAS